MRRLTLSFRSFGLILVVCGLVLTASSLFAFSTVTADRQASIVIADSSNAYFGMSVTDPTVAVSARATPTPREGTTVSTTPSPTTGGSTMAGSSARSPHAREQTLVIGTVTNRFTSELTTLDITISGDAIGGLTVRKVSVAAASLPPSSSSKLIATIDCSSATGATDMVTLDIVASGPSIRISTTRTMQVTCTSPPATGMNNPVPTTRSSGQALSVVL